MISLDLMLFTKCIQRYVPNGFATRQYALMKLAIRQAKFNKSLLGGGNRIQVAIVAFQPQETSATGTKSLVIGFNTYSHGRY